MIEVKQINEKSFTARFSHCSLSQIFNYKYTIKSSRLIKTTESEEIQSKIFYNHVRKKSFNLKLVGQEFKPEIVLLFQINLRSLSFDLQLPKCHMTAGVFSGGGSVQYITVIINMSQHSEGFHFKMIH